MEYDVTIDRNKYIGGSDIPIIMGLSPFKTRWQLMQEKAGLVENTFTGNRATEYGHEIELIIRAYINEKYNTNFEPNRVINGDFRAHTDGFNGSAVLEIKSTSVIHETIDEYIYYLVQLLKYMQINKVKKGILAVYHRPEDYSLEFNPKRLQIFNVTLSKYKDLLEKVNAEIHKFRADLQCLKENHLLAEVDFLPPVLVALSNAALDIENRLAKYKAIEVEYKEVKKNLFNAMQKYNIKGWEMPNGTKVARVDGKAAVSTTEIVFDLETFQEENPALYAMYLKEKQVITRERAGYVKITQQKEELQCMS